MIAKTTLSNGLANWIDLLDERYPLVTQSNLVYGALRHYDLPTLAAP